MSDSKRVLLIEDDEYLRRSLAKLFTTGGAEVIQTSSGSFARDNIDPAGFSIVISDYDLGWGEPNGAEVVEGFMQTAPEVRYIIMSGLDRQIPDGVEFFDKGSGISLLVDMVGTDA